MKPTTIPTTLALLTLLLTSTIAMAFTVEFQRRDPGSGKIRTYKEELDPKRVAVVAVDVWNYHWCKTSTERVSALVPRINKVLEQARGLGMTVFLCPTDVADNYVGTPMVERVIAVDPVPLPKVKSVQCPPAPDGGGCTCGVERCLGSFGWDGMHPKLTIGPNDLMPNDPERLYAICKERGLTDLLYVGFHTQVCLLGKSIGLRAMSEAGFRCALARDVTDAHGHYIPGGETPDDFTAKVVAHFEKHLAPTFNFAETLKQNGKWNDEWLVDLVHHSPWGRKQRPHLFEKTLTVALTNPEHPKADVRFTTDGSEPTSSSPLYTAPLKVKNTTWIRAAAFKNGNRVTRFSNSYSVKLLPVPPKPEVYLGDLKPWRAVGLGHSPSFDFHRLSPGVQPPQVNKSNEGKPLRMHGVEFPKGIGVHAPNQLIYELKPEWYRFVARAGVDENVIAVAHGSNRGMHPSVIFRIFIDGKMVAESPMMRLRSEPWRFNLAIPPGSKRISLNATDGGNGHYLDLANWVEAGFVGASKEVPPPNDDQ